MPPHFPFRARAARRLWPAALLALLGPAAWGVQGGALGAVPVLTAAAGRVELLGAGGAWGPGTAQGQDVSGGLRTGAGRAGLRVGGGELVVGPASQLRRLRDEADLLAGRFVLRGPAAVHVQGKHLVMDGPGRVRVDLGGVERRVAVLGGVVRLDLGGRVVTLSAGQQLALGSGAISPFQEADPWYDAQFRGEGDAVVDALRGAVTLRPAGAAAGRPVAPGEPLRAGDALEAGGGAWAEVRFSGGGYLRLCADSALRVLSVSRTSRGREVLLSLSRGTAWNVVERGQGGYRIDTPVVSTAVRGTLFRVDATGVVKVLEGAVAAPSASGETALAAGQQRAAGGAVGALVLDALDQQNLALDAERARPLTLELRGGPVQALRELRVEARSLDGARLGLELRGPDGQRQTLPLSAGPGGLYTLAAPLPEGRYQATLRAARADQARSRALTLTIDRTPPRVGALTVTRRGRLIDVRVAASDNLPGPLSVTVRAGSYVGTRSLAGQARWPWLVPAASPDGSVRVTVRDAAGNESDVTRP